MELHRDTNPCSFHITSYEPGLIHINKTPIPHSLLIHPSRIYSSWRPQSWQELTIRDIESCLSYKPDLVLIGTGELHQQVPSKLLAPLYANNIGVEVMRSSAACKTFALLSSDQRNVLAAVLIR